VTWLYWVPRRARRLLVGRQACDKESGWPLTTDDKGNAMRKTLLAVTLAFGAGLAADLSAQGWDAARPGEGDLGSISLITGLVSPTSTLPDESTHENGVAVGASAVWWATRHVGLRAHAIRSQTDGVEGSIPSSAARHDPTVWFYGAELAVRYPMGGEGLSWFPYLSAGPGGKSYRWAIERPRIGDSSFVWSFGGGVDVRPGSDRFGIVIDVRNHRSTYTWHGNGPSFRSKGFAERYTWPKPVVNDLVFTVGVSVSR